ncbi:MAG: PP2C family protein-serine/threonine phosphatase [Candidatus Sericytochromatia bacterium]
MKPPYFASHAVLTDPGRVRSNNEDAGDGFALREPKPGAVSGMLVVSDGMGGHAAGEVASALIVTGWRRWAEQLSSHGLTPETLDAAALHGLAELHQQVLQEAERTGHHGMGATFVSVCLLDQGLCVYNVGDSGAYLCRGRECFTLHRSDNEVESLLAQGKITAEAAAQSHARSHLLQAVGYHGVLRPHSAHTPVKAGDRVLLCSDGLTAHVAPSEWPEILASLPDDEAAARYLIRLANQRGGTDNITVAIATIRGGQPQWKEREVSYPNGRKLSFRILGGSLLLLGLGALWALNRPEPEPPPPQVSARPSPVASVSPSLRPSVLASPVVTPTATLASAASSAWVTTTSRGSGYVLRLTLDRSSGRYLATSLPEQTRSLLELIAQPVQTQASASPSASPTASATPLAAEVAFEEQCLPVDVLRQNEMLGELIIRVTRTAAHYEVIVEPARKVFLNREEFPPRTVHELPLASPPDTRLGLYLRRDDSPGYNFALVIPNLLLPFSAPAVAATGTASPAVNPLPTAPLVGSPVSSPS